MTDIKTGWLWFSGSNDEHYSDTHNTREEAIAALEGFGGYIVEAIQEPENFISNDPRHSRRPRAGRPHRKGGITMRDKIAAIIQNMPEVACASEVADAILAAMPGMIPGLVWEDKHTVVLSSSAATRNGKYHVAFDDDVDAWYASLEIGDHDCPIMIEPLDVDTFAAAKVAANAHHRAAMCKAMGWAE